MPAIISPGNDLSDELRKVDCAWILDSYVESEVTKTIKKFAEVSNELLARKGAAGRQFVKQKLDQTIFSNKLQKLITK